MKIGGLIKTSLVDYPGKVAASVFTIGCNFRCGYCHNPELVDPKRYTDEMAETWVLEFLESRKGLLDGVAISGGEPTLQPDLAGFCRKCKGMGYLVKLDSNGSNPDVLQRLINEKLVDYLAMDIKGPLTKYEKIMGWPIAPEKIQHSVHLIINSGQEHEFRTTVVKGILEVEDFEEIGRLINGAARFALQHFRAISEMVNSKEYASEKTFSDTEFASAKEIMQKYVTEVVIH